MTDNQLYEEKQLLLRIAGGDETAFRQVFHEYSDFLLSYLLQITKSRELAEELVQDIFVQVWRAREFLHQVRNFKSYLFIISRNHALNALKKLARKQHREREWSVMQPTVEQDIVPDAMYLDLIDEAIEQLPSQQKLVWIMSRRQGKKYITIAEELNLSRETVKKYLQYATASIIENAGKKLDMMLLLSVCFTAF